MKKIRPLVLLICIGIPLAIGQFSALLTRNTGTVYQMLEKPPFSPPAIVFPIVWTILYILMGISSYLIFTSQSADTSSALSWYAIQLFFNFFWSLIFFNHGNYLLSFIWLLILILLIIIMIIQFYRISPPAAYLQIPYLLWCIFAAYLNFAIYRLNY